MVSLLVSSRCLRNIIYFRSVCLAVCMVWCEQKQLFFISSFFSIITFYRLKTDKPYLYQRKFCLLKQLGSKIKSTTCVSKKVVEKIPLKFRLFVCVCVCVWGVRIEIHFDENIMRQFMSSGRKNFFFFFSIFPVFFLSLP